MIPLLSPLFAALALAADPAPASIAALHDVHVSHTRMVVEGTRVIARVRLFADDLRGALQADARDSTLELTPQRAAERFGRYWGSRVTLRADGALLAGRVTAAGSERDVGGYEMWWFVVELDAKRPVRALTLANRLLFERFRDQQNLVTVLRMPGERRSALFFATGDTAAKRVE